MSDPALSALIREVLAEELARLKPASPSVPQAETESVTIASSADLNAFARTVLALARDPARLAKFNAGKLSFELAGTQSPGTPAPATATTAASGPVHTIETGFVSERQIDRLPNGIKRLVLGKPVRITPLARDRARQRGMIIERMST